MQHEIDHLNGTLPLHRPNPAERLSRHHGVRCTRDQGCRRSRATAAARGRGDSIPSAVLLLVEKFEKSMNTASSISAGGPATCGGCVS
jgi:hypothetical protein